MQLHSTVTTLPDGCRVSRLHYTFSGYLYSSSLLFDSFHVSYGLMILCSVSGSPVHRVCVCFRGPASERGSQLIAYVLHVELQLLNPAVALMQLLSQRSDLFLLLIKDMQQLKHRANVHTNSHWAHSGHNWDQIQIGLLSVPPFPRLVVYTSLIRTTEPHSLCLSNSSTESHPPAILIGHRTHTLLSDWPVLLLHRFPGCRPRAPALELGTGSALWSQASETWALGLEAQCFH